MYIKHKHNIFSSTLHGSSFQCNYHQCHREPSTLNLTISQKVFSKSLPQNFNAFVNIKSMHNTLFRVLTFENMYILHKHRKIMIGHRVIQPWHSSPDLRSWKSSNRMVVSHSTFSICHGPPLSFHHGKKLGKKWYQYKYWIMSVWIVRILQNSIDVFNDNVAMNNIFRVNIGMNRVSCKYY